MELIDLKDRFNRIRFLFSNIRYYRPKHLYISILLIVIIISVSTVALFLKQKNEMRQKENILKSYYEEADDLYQNYSGKRNLSASENSLVEDSNGFENITTKIKVYICGYVKNPGVYEVENDARIVDLISLCGGQTQEACLEVVNLAQKISDGDMVYIPSEEEVKEKGAELFTDDFVTNGIVNSDTDKNSSLLNVINLNTATKEELIILPGIGEKTAQNIIEYRNKYGFFKTKEEIKNVKGIGEKKYEKIKDLITI